MMLHTAESDVLVALLWRTTWQSCVLTLVVFAVTSGLRRWITPKWRSVLWLVPACRLLMLLVPASTFSLFNLIGPVDAGPIPTDYANATLQIDGPATGQPVSRSAIERPPSQLSTMTPVNEWPEITSQASLDTPPTSETAIETPDPKVSVTSAIVGVWMFGCVTATILWIRSQIILSRVIAKGRVSTDPAIVEICESRRQALRLRRKIQCVVLDDDIGPAVCGLFCPRILLPSSLIRELSAEELRAVMVHEIEHIRRWDGVYSLLGRLVTVIHWFNPLAYIIRRNLRHQIELAVDASTIAAIGEDLCRSYGELLIQLAQRPSRICGLAHMAAKRSNLRSRINELALPAKASRFRSSLAFFAAVVLVICGLTDAASTQDLTASAQAPSASDRDGNATPATPPPEQTNSSTELEELIRRIHETPNWRFVDTNFIESIEARQAELRGTHVTLRGTVIDEQNGPVTGAFVILRLPSNYSSMRRGVDGRVQDVFAVGWTDERGQFAFNDQPTPWFESGHPLTWEICVFASGYAVETTSFQGMDAPMPRVTMPLTRECLVDGTIQDPNGKPIEQMAYGLVEIVNPYDHAEFELSLLHSEIQCVVRTDEYGRFQIGGLPPQRIVSLLPIGVAGSAGSVIRVATSSDLKVEGMIKRDSPGSGLVFPYFEPTFEATIESPLNDRAEANAPATEESSNSHPTRTVTVRVINADEGGGVSDVGVGWDHNVDGIRIKPGMQATDDDGVATLNIPQRPVDIFVGGRRYGYLTQYDRITTNPEEYTPTVASSEWVRRVAAGDQDFELTFEVKPVAPLRLTVQKEDGTPAVAEIRVYRRGWGEAFVMPVIDTDDKGQVTIAARPVMFDIDIAATTESGLQGSLSVDLSKDLQDSEAAIVTVK